MDGSPLFPRRVETERLELERLSTDAVDVLEYYRICSGQADDGEFEEVTEHLTWDPHAHPKETLDYLRHAENRAREGEGAEYLVRPTEGEAGAGEIAGATGMTVDWDRRTAEFGLWLRRPFWGRGYSGERAAALLAVAFERLDLEAVVVTADADNEQSRRAIEKYVDAHGGRYEGVIRYADLDSDGDPIDKHRFTVTAGEYRAATDGSAVVAME